MFRISHQWHHAIIIHECAGVFNVRDGDHIFILRLVATFSKSSGDKISITTLSIKCYMISSIWSASVYLWWQFSSLFVVFVNNGIIYFLWIPPLPKFTLDRKYHHSHEADGEQQHKKEAIGLQQRRRRHCRNCWFCRWWNWKKQLVGFWLVRFLFGPLIDHKWMAIREFHRV